MDLTLVRKIFCLSLLFQGLTHNKHTKGHPRKSD